MGFQAMYHSYLKHVSECPQQADQLSAADWPRFYDVYRVPSDVESRWQTRFDEDNADIIDKHCVCMYVCVCVCVFWCFASSSINTFLQESLLSMDPVRRSLIFSAYFNEAQDTELRSSL